MTYYVSSGTLNPTHSLTHPHVVTVGFKRLSCRVKRHKQKDKLHWLPGEYWINFKIANITFNTLLFIHLLTYKDTLTF